MKKIVASILTAIMLMVVFQTAAFAAEGEGAEANVSPKLGGSVIYLNQTDGADDNDGLTKATAVKTIQKANELAESRHVKDICFTSIYEVTGAEVWDLGGKTIHRGTAGYMIELGDASASLTLGNVVIDAENWHPTETGATTDSIIKAANGGTIVLKSGAILQNNKAMQFGSGILANNGVKITMEDGAIIRNNSNENYELGGGILIGNGSTFTMNGGEISGNSANGGGGVAIIGASMVMNGGIISNNSTYRTSGQKSYGAGVYVADYANASGGNITGPLFTPAPASFEMNGGTISGNTALDYGGGVLTFPQQGEKVTININGGTISGNQVTKGSGGAIAAFFGDSEVNIKGGKLAENSAQNYGGGIFLYTVTNVTISDGVISKNKAAAGGGVCLWGGSAVKQTGGSIENNVANAGGGVFGGTYTMTGGVIKDNNNALTEENRRAAKGDGVYVGAAFNLGNNAVVRTNNDVYLKKGSPIAKEGRYINVISAYTGASAAKPILIHSEDCTVEGTEIGTQLVYYTNDAGGVNAAAQADANGFFAPSWKMPEGLVIGRSKATGKTDWMTYVPSVCIHYEWVSTDNPSDVTPPADDYIRAGTAYTAKGQQNTHQGYTFDGWYTNEQCTLRYNDGTMLDVNTTLYGKWTTAYGNLSVTKAVSGSAGDTFKAFNFSVTLGDASVSGAFGEMTFTDGVATFTLKHGERKTASALPAGIAYTVTEAEANQDGYTTTSDNASGSIVKDDTVTAAFTNTKDGADEPNNPGSGNLSVTKAVSGSAGDTFKAFNFTVTLGDASVNGAFGEMTFTDGVATFALKHGERKTASALPAGIAYTVTEAEANQDGYTTTSDNASGSIVKDDTVTAAFTNTKDGADVTDVPSKPITPDHLPATGDTANLRLWIFMMGLSLTGLILSLAVEKKRSHRNHKI